MPNPPSRSVPQREGIPSPPRDVLPAYCCAILLDSAGRFVLEQRPQTDTDAPGRLTCFGGGRHPNETPLDCLHRELQEELAFTLGPAQHVLTLSTPAGPAWFYTAVGPECGSVQACEPGHAVRWIDQAALFDSPLADWHRAALLGWVRGQATASVVDS